MKDYYVYILTNSNRTVLYTGVTSDMRRRLREHKTGQRVENSFCTRYAVNRLVYVENFQDIRYAIAREKEIKGWRKEKKVELIETVNPSWRFLDEI